MKKLEQTMFDEFVKSSTKDRTRYKFITKYGLSKRSRNSARAMLGWNTRRRKRAKQNEM